MLTQEPAQAIPSNMRAEWKSQLNQKREAIQAAGQPAYGSAWASVVEVRTVRRFQAVSQQLMQYSPAVHSSAHSQTFPCATRRKLRTTSSL